MSFRDKLKIACAQTAGPKGPSLCPSDTAVKIIICHWKRKTDAKILFSDQSRTILTSP